MDIRRVEIANFRGIQTLDWTLNGKLTCLIGPGDSSKTTILDAIELALTPRYDPAFSDIDFHDLDNDHQIAITVTVGNLPDTLRPDSKFGLHLRGWDPATGFVDEPHDPLEGLLSVRLTVDEHLEPRWVAWTERGEKPISAADRAALGVVRIGREPAWHLTWSRKSALARISSRDELNPDLAHALRNVRQYMAQAELPGLSKAARTVEEAATALGVLPTTGYRPGMSPQAISLRHGAMSLHDGTIPITSAGSGTQRLAAIAVQQLSVREGAILLLDEVEMGLEPHRVRHLIRSLREQPGLGQAVLTSHSSVAIAELHAAELAVVRSHSGALTVRRAGSQGTVRAAAEALLSRSIIVCEGKTEVGLCRAWDATLWRKSGRPPLAQVGTHPLDGEGSTAPRRALQLQSLGYRTLLFIDSDVELDTALRARLAENDIVIVEWTDNTKTEERICLDLPWVAIKAIVELAAQERGVESVRDSVFAQIGTAVEVARPLNLDLDDWLGVGLTEASIRSAVAAAATVKKKEWFKRIDRGEALGKVIAAHIDLVHESDLALKIATIESWSFAD